MFVFNEKNEYIGVINQRSIARSRSDPSKTKIRKLVKKVPRISKHDSISEAARLMIESGIRELPVFEGKVLVGFVSDEDIIHGAVLKKWGNTRVKELMTQKPHLLEEEESVGAALSLFRAQNISHIPVVNNGKLVGIVSFHDIIEKVFQPRNKMTQGEIVGEKTPVLSLPIKGIMYKPVITVLPSNNLKQAVVKLHKFNISCLVVTKRRRPIGIITKLDFLEPIAQLEQPYRRLSIQFSVKDVGIDDVKQSFIMDDFKSFASKYGKVVESGTLFVYIKGHGSNFKGDQLVHCRLQLRSVKGSFFSSGEGWGIEQTFRLALDRLESQILRSKDLSYNREYAEEYLQRISFPYSDL